MLITNKKKLPESLIGCTWIASHDCHRPQLSGKQTIHISLFVPSEPSLRSRRIKGRGWGGRIREKNIGVGRGGSSVFFPLFTPSNPTPPLYTPATQATLSLTTKINFNISKVSSNFRNTIIRLYTSNKLQCRVIWLRQYTIQITRSLTSCSSLWESEERRLK